MKTFAAMAAALMMLVLTASAALAVQNAVTPSTNEINTTNSWAHVVVTAVDPGSATLTFVSTRGFFSCFEYRTDGGAGQQTSPTNFNPLVTDGLYPFRCVNNSTSVVMVSANVYLEVRMVFGAESDERFDWTRFEVVPPPPPTCTPTGLIRDGINLTAAVNNPTTPVTGIVDATTCNIGVYYGPGLTGTVDDAEIFGANYYGVVANAAAVNVTDSSIHDIGEVPLNGSQHGVGVLYTTVNQASQTTGPSASGTLSNTTIWNYQKNGVVISGVGASASVLNNTVTGQGAVDWIAQNGIQVSFGGSALITGNTVSGNDYTPKSFVACGLLYFDAGGVKASNNDLFGNERNVCNFGRGGGSFDPS